MATLLLTTGTNLDNTTTVGYSFSGNASTSAGSSATAIDVNNLPSLFSVSDSSNAVLQWDVDYISGANHDDGYILYAALVNDVTDTVLVGAGAGTWDGTSVPTTTGYALVTLAQNHGNAGTTNFASSDTGAGGVYVNTTVGDWTASGGTPTWRFWQEEDPNMAGDSAYFDVDQVTFTLDYQELHVLTSTDTSAASSTTSETINQAQDLSGQAVTSSAASSTSSETISQLQVLDGQETDVSTTSSTSSETISQNQILTGQHTEPSAASSTSSETINQVQELNTEAQDVSTASSTSSETINQHQDLVGQEVDTSAASSTSSETILQGENLTGQETDVGTTSSTSSETISQNQNLVGQSVDVSAASSTQSVTVEQLSVISTKTDFTEPNADTMVSLGNQVLVAVTSASFTDSSSVDTMSGSGEVDVNITDNTLPEPAGIADTMLSTGSQVLVQSTSSSFTELGSDNLQGSGFQQRPTLYINMPTGYAGLYTNI